VIQFPAYSALIADSLSPESRGKGIGLLNTVSNSLGIFAPYLAGLVIARFETNLGMRILYGGMVALNLAATWIQFRFLKENSLARREPLQFSVLLNALGQAYRGIPNLVRQMPPSLKALTLVVMFSFMATGLSGSFWVVFATERQGLTAEEWGVIMLVEAVIRLGLFLPAGLLVDRWGRTVVLAASLVIATLATPLFVVLSGFAAILLVRAVLAVTFVMAFASCVTLMADLVPGPVRGQLMAAIGMGGIMPGMVGSPGGPAVGYLVIPPLMIASLAGGFLYRLNPVLPWAVSTAIGALSVLLVVFFVRDSHK
jgi:MFS family permease